MKLSKEYNKIKDKSKGVMKMKLRIKETQEVKVLEIRDKNGIEWTMDLLGNYDTLQFNDKTGEYEMSQEDYDWWSEYIKNHKADEQRVTELAEELGIREFEIWDRINRARIDDLSDEHTVITNILEVIRNEALR